MINKDKWKNFWFTFILFYLSPILIDLILIFFLFYLLPFITNSYVADENINHSAEYYIFGIMSNCLFVAPIRFVIEIIFYKKNSFLDLLKEKLVQISLIMIIFFIIDFIFICILEFPTNNFLDLLGVFIVSIFTLSLFLTALPIYLVVIYKIVKSKFKNFSFSAFVNNIIKIIAILLVIKNYIL